MPDINKAISFLVHMANDNEHGYSQSGKRIEPNIDKIKDSDCSGSGISALMNAGFDMSGATYTGNIYPVLLRNGFKNIKGQTDSYVAGDIFLRPPTKDRGGHFAMYIGAGRIVQFAGNFDGRSGDSSGNEVRIQDLYDMNPKYIMRYEEVKKEEPALFAIKVVKDTNIRKQPSKDGEIVEVCFGKDQKVLGISQVKNNWGRIQNQKDKWISVNPNYSGVVRI